MESTSNLKFPLSFTKRFFIFKRLDNIIMEIKTWTPLYANKPLNKDEFGNNPWAHPLVIFKTEKGYFYLSCTSQIHKQKEFHVVIPKSIPKDKTKEYLFNRTSLIDTRRIFYMNKKDFEKCFELDENKNPAYYNSPEISDKYKIQVLNKIIFNLNYQNFSFIECKLNKENKVNSNPIILGRKTINLIMKSLDKQSPDFDSNEKAKIKKYWNNYFNKITLQKNNNKDKLQISLNKIYKNIYASINMELKRISSNINKQSWKESLGYYQ